MTVATIEQSREQWLARRMTGIGASEAAAVLGISPWMTKLELYLLKTGDFTPKERVRMRFGTLFQNGIAEAYSEDTGRELVLANHDVAAHSEFTWMLASPDALAIDRPVEIKKVSQYMAQEYGESGTDQIPAYYALQLQQQMAVWGYEVADLAALIGDDDFRIFTVHRNDAVIAQLAEAERQFMLQVERRQPPLPDFDNPRMAEILALIEPVPGQVTELGDDVSRLVAAYERVGSFANRCEKAQKFAKARILAAIGDAECATLPDGTTLSRPKVERAGYTVEPTSYYQLKIKHPKPIKEKKHVNRNRVDRRISAE